MTNFQTPDLINLRFKKHLYYLVNGSKLRYKFCMAKVHRKFFLLYMPRNRSIRRLYLNDEWIFHNYVFQRHNFHHTDNFLLHAIPILRKL